MKGKALTIRKTGGAREIGRLGTRRVGRGHWTDGGRRSINDDGRERNCGWIL